MQFLNPVPPPPPECSTLQLSLQKMSSSRAEPKGKRGSEGGGGGGGGGFHRVQAERDLASNWEVDLAQKLEEYLIKICSGEIPTEADGLTPVNFAEAALLLQGSVQVYGRKVEYLYALVLRALEFLSQRQQEQLEGASVTPQECSVSQSVSADKDDLFWGLDDIPAEANIRLDSQSGKGACLKYLAKPPAKLDVREGDCLDGSGDTGELESYLLATSDLYLGFILLDPRDALAIPEDLDGDKPSKGQNSAYGSSSKASSRKSFQSPSRRSEGTLYKSPLGKSKDATVNLSPRVEVNNINVGHDFPTSSNSFDSNHAFDIDNRDSQPGEIDDSENEDDPWKPLNPHEPGTLRIKPFMKVKDFKRNEVYTIKQISVATLFPPARLHGPTSPELRKIWEMRRHEHERPRNCQSPSPYERLRLSLTGNGHEIFDPFLNPGNGNEDNGNDSGINFEQPDDDMPENIYMDEDVPHHSEMHDDDNANFGLDDPFIHEDPNPHTNLEDLCRSHLDALLASIAETEKQSELVARVSTWKQKIEHNLEEQESHAAFDIHDYGERILGKLSLEADDTDILSFADVVKGQEKYDVARSFSALLQLVNNGNVELDRSGADGGKSFCYTAENPFHVRLLRQDNREKKAEFQLARKRKVRG